MFTSPQEQLEIIKIMNFDKKWGFTDAHFKKVERLPIQPTGELQTTVLVPYFGTVQKTFDTLWDSVEVEGHTKWRWSELQKVRLHKGKHPKKQLKWVTLDFGVNWDKTKGKSVEEVRKEDPNLAGVEVLAAALVHPGWVLSIDGEEVPHADLGGLDAHYNASWSYCPYFYRLVVARQLELRAYWAAFRHRYFSAPRVREAEFEPLETGASDGSLELDPCTDIEESDQFQTEQRIERVRKVLKEVLREEREAGALVVLEKIEDCIKEIRS